MILPRILSCRNAFDGRGYGDRAAALAGPRPTYYPADRAKEELTRAMASPRPPVDRKTAPGNPSKHVFSMLVWRERHRKFAHSVESPRWPWPNAQRFCPKIYECLRLPDGLP
jgi:hypothetical protein